jgi:hypothetical protein
MVAMVVVLMDGTVVGWRVGEMQMRIVEFEPQQLLVVRP